jgi:hypothetical protein
MTRLATWGAIGTVIAVGATIGATAAAGADGDSIQAHSSAFTKTSVSITIRNRVVFGTVSNSDDRCFHNSDKVYKVNLLRDFTLPGADEDDIRDVASTRLRADGRYRFPRLRLHRYGRYYTQIRTELTCTTGSSRVVRYRGY